MMISKEKMHETYTQSDIKTEKRTQRDKHTKRQTQRERERDQ